MSNITTTEVYVDDLVPDSLEIEFFTTYLVGTVIVSCLFVVHCWKVYSDLCTKPRKSVSHRRAIPKLTAQYKWIGWLTLSSIFLYAAFELFAWLQMALNHTPEGCARYIFSNSFPWTFSKATMYSVFITRLHNVFGGSAYGYSAYVRYLILTMAWIPALIIPIATVYYAPRPDDSFILLDHDEYPNPCFVALPSWIFTLFLVWDMIMNVLCLILFMNPLTRSMRAISASVSDVTTVKRMTDKMVYVGVKLSILAAVTSVSSIITLICLIVGVLQFLFSMDAIINTACLMLMTQYYPDNIFFEKLCVLCLLCCPVQYRSQARVKKARADNTSKDTLMVPKYAANATQLDYNNVNNDTPIPNVNTAIQLNVHTTSVQHGLTNQDDSDDPEQEILDPTNQVNEPSEFN